MCDKGLGTPFEKCNKVFQISVSECRLVEIKVSPEANQDSTLSISFSEKLGVLNMICDVTYLAKMFCYSFKLIDYSCEAFDFTNGPLAGTVKR